MTDLARRTFVQSLAISAPLIGAACSSLGTGAAQQAGSGLDPATLRALAETVLPTDLGPADIQGTVTSFLAWLDGYDPVAEVNHGYGTGDLAYLPADPAPAWAAQLAALDLEARKRTGVGFAALDPDRRRTVVEARLAGVRDDGFPAPHEAGHVAVGLMAWFYATPGATDLCYRARIGRETCRDLMGVTGEPAPFGGEG